MKLYPILLYIDKNSLDISIKFIYNCYILYIKDGKNEK